MNAPTNDERATAAESSLWEYRNTWAQHEEDITTCATDMIANLLHLLRREGYNDEDMERAYRISWNHFEAEEAEERTAEP